VSVVPVIETGTRVLAVPEDDDAEDDAVVAPSWEQADEATAPTVSVRTSRGAAERRR
jgi:hypothetical protein